MALMVEEPASILGLDFYTGTLGDAADRVVARAQSGLGGYASLTSVHGLTLAQNDCDVMSALQGAWTNFPDGMPIRWWQRRLGYTDAERVSGADLMPLVFERGKGAGLRHFFFGSTDRVLELLASTLATRWPGVHVCGTYSPPFGPIDSHDADGHLDRVVEAQPDIVWVGLGAPKQDLWAQQYADRVAPALTVAVGAAFEFVAGTRRRAPEWMQRHGLEWTHRLASEPRRLTGRYARSNTRFLMHVTRETLRSGARPRVR
jgi:N-acetylglucosaminyldiphosphoundecaprenol N-acetyl-beta-D-mannosaminyltransferase